MPIVFNPLFDILKERGYSSTRWLRSNGLHATTVDKLRKNESVTTESIGKICELLHVQPAQIMQYVEEPTYSQHENK